MVQINIPKNSPIAHVTIGSANKKIYSIPIKKLKTLVEVSISEGGEYKNPIPRDLIESQGKEYKLNDKESLVISKNKQIWSIVIPPYSDIVSFFKNTYKVDFPTLYAKLTLSEQGKPINLELHYKDLKKKKVPFEAPNISLGRVCLGNFNIAKQPSVTPHNYVKHILQTPFTEDYFKSDPAIFFKIWEEKDYQEALQYELSIKETDE